MTRTSAMRGSRIRENIVLVRDDCGRDGEPQEGAVLDPGVAEFLLPFWCGILAPVAGRNQFGLHLRTETALVGHVNRVVAG